MEFKFCQKPSGAVCNQIKNIYNHCQEAFPGLTLSSGIGTGEDAPDRYLLVFRENNIIAYAAIFEFDITNLVYLFVDPAFQRQGLFYQMQEHLIKCDPDMPLELATDEIHPGARHLIASGSFTRMDCQLLLSYTRSTFLSKTVPADLSVTPAITLHSTTDSKYLAKLHQQIFHLSDEQSYTLEFIKNMLDIDDIHAFLIKENEARIGLGFLLPEENTCCLSSFGILPAHQKKGCATAALRCICDQLFKHSKMQKLTVQVDGENEAALRLYESFGFQPAQTFSTYTPINRA